MVGSTTPSVAIAIACLVIVALLTIPTVIRLVQNLRRRKERYQELNDRYEDKDGVATTESEAAFSDIVQRLILLLASTVATIDALAFAVVIATKPQLSLAVEQWLQFGTWIFVLVQSIVVFTTLKSADKYTLGVYTSISALAIIIAVAVENLSLWQQNILHIPRNIHLTFSLIQFFAGLLIFVTGLLIPRRPDVYRDGQIVDRQYTTSMLGRLSFSWPSNILLYAVRNRALDYKDLPEIANNARAATLTKRFAGVQRDKLWKSIFLAHRYSFIQQWVLQAICSVTNFLPQIALYFILRVLERRDQGLDVGFQAWLLVAGLGLAVTISSWVEAYMFFVAFMRVGVPVYEQLSAVIFAKSIRRKDVKGTTKIPDADQKLANGDITINENAGPKGEDMLPESPPDGDEEDTAKTRQSTINLVGVDGKRISDFSMFCYIFLGAAIKLIIAVSFLVNLIGWIPMLSGFVAPALILPLNIWASKKYASAQDDLMKYRDQKMAVVTEALQGIRQIKFSALEREWYDKVLQTRRRELKTQWACFCWDATLISIWIFGPVFLSAISLTVYAVIHKELTASVAFTTISVFEAIEMTLAIIPEMITDLLDCLVSARRIQTYLDSPEVTEQTQPGSRIKFTGATISWPSDDVTKEEAMFHLRSLDLDFPKDELSVISGRTGSGKTLLLASIIGEAEVSEGTVTVPRPPPAEERYDSKATRVPGSFRNPLPSSPKFRGSRMQLFETTFYSGFLLITSDTNRCFTAVR
ncbi:ATP-dependent bile acid permease [Cyphellophora attinorum]|uniref:ATP-dependent bile acid permease n=1 Tax=Cyphellophora attinorum TaxID=1664694 RepID=A0A0N1H3I0_9EURO|nr:ATP-dependent bile acid permease [Phialophora attinorum]KPI39577.1 ATP-dependent bile acid permease [Phialophora attinorum]